MARPGGSRAAASKTSQNPITTWMENRAQRKREAEEQAARQITDDTADNEEKIVRILSQIDFIHSPIPKEILDAKSSLVQPCGDLEYGAKAAIRYLHKHPLTIQADLRPIDEKLLMLAAYFKQSVEQGNQSAAYAAKAGLLRGLKEIRGRVPQVEEVLVPRYIDQNVRYLDEWIALVELAEGADCLKIAKDQYEQKYKEAVKEDEDNMAKFFEELNHDNLKYEAFKAVRETTDKEGRKDWSIDVQQMHATLVDQQLKKSEIKVKFALFDTNQKKYQTLKQRVEILDAKLSSLKIVPNQDALNKYQDAIDDMVKEMAQNDAELKEMLDSMTALEGQLAQLENAPGNTTYREMAVERAYKVVEERQKEQERRLARETAGGGLLAEFGIHSEEEMQQLIKQKQEEQRRQAEEMMAEESNEEDQRLYN